MMIIIMLLLMIMMRMEDNEILMRAIIGEMFLGVGIIASVVIIVVIQVY